MKLLTVLSLLANIILIQLPVFILSNHLADNLRILDDEIQFMFNWPGKYAEKDLQQEQNIEIIDIKTINKEAYKCKIPNFNDEIHLNDKNKQFPSTDQIKTSLLLSPLYDKKLCSYRIESYWIYELCHGQFVRQYHETKSAGKRIINEEYYLGFYNLSKQDPDYLKQNDDNKLKANVNWRTLNGESVPMYGVKYTDGTMCEILKDTPREIMVFYICDEFGKDDIILFEEISSCSYEMIVATSSICSHPAYKLPEKIYPSIDCYLINNSPQKPYELTSILQEQDIFLNNNNKVKMTDKQGETIIIHYKTIDDEDLNSNKFQVEIEQQPSRQQKEDSEVKELQKPYFQQISNEAQKEMIKSFLSGSLCLHGGSGWWKYEVCFNKHVMQYHEDEKTKKRTNILLGEWNLKNHLDWLNKYPNKRVLNIRSERVQNSVLYSNGAKCDETQTNRFVEVKFKCIRSKMSSSAISLYLIEPALCEYMLVVESTWLCEYVESVDINGLLPS